MDADSMADSSAGFEDAAGPSSGGVSRSDLRRGYSNAETDAEPGDGLLGGTEPYGEPDRHHGFLDRPQGWER
ncbi:MAG TPA: hypothetical protein VIL30_16740 [Ramlibacter sp.]|jgi:hypothetical protein